MGNIRNKDIQHKACLSFFFLLLLPSYGKFIMVIWVKASVKLHNRTEWYAVNKGKHRVGIKRGFKFRYTCYANSIYTCINEQTTWLKDLLQTTLCWYFSCL